MLQFPPLKSKRKQISILSKGASYDAQMLTESGSSSFSKALRTYCTKSSHFAAILPIRQSLRLSPVTSHRMTCSTARQNRLRSDWLWKQKHIMFEGTVVVTGEDMMNLLLMLQCRQSSLVLGKPACARCDRVWTCALVTRCWEENSFLERLNRRENKIFH